MIRMTFTIECILKQFLSIKSHSSNTPIAWCDWNSSHMVHYFSPGQINIFINKPSHHSANHLTFSDMLEHKVCNIFSPLGAASITQIYMATLYHSIPDCQVWKFLVPASSKPGAPTLSVESETETKRRKSAIALVFMTRPLCLSLKLRT